MSMPTGSKKILIDNGNVWDEECLEVEWEEVEEEFVVVCDSEEERIKPNIIGY